MELKKMIEGITKKSPADQQLYNKEDAGSENQNHNKGVFKNRKKGQIQQIKIQIQQRGL